MAIVNTHKVRYAEVRAHKVLSNKQTEAARQIEYWPDWFKELFVVGRLYWGKGDYLTVKRNQEQDQQPEYGNWIVFHADGRLEIMTQTAFEMRYELLKQEPVQQELDLPPI